MLNSVTGKLFSFEICHTAEFWVSKMRVAHEDKGKFWREKFEESCYLEERGLTGSGMLNWVTKDYYWKFVDWIDLAHQ